MAGAIVAALTSALVAAGATAATATILATAVVQVGLSFGVSALASVFLKRQPERKPSQRQFLDNSPVSPRTRSYGRVRTSGSQMAMMAVTGDLFRVIALNDGEIDGFEAHYLDDKECALDGSGYVTDPAKYVEGAKKFARILTRTGTATQTAYAELTAAVPEWDNTHRLLGVANALTVYTQPAAENISKVFPRYENTSYTARFRGARVLDPRTNTVAWSDNAALVILDFLLHETGFGLPFALVSPEIEAWKHAADVCDQLVTTRTGSQIKRYRISGTYDYAERPADILDRMLAACNGKLWLGPNGGLQLLVGEWVAPTVTIGQKSVLEYRLSAGNEAPETYNILQATYTEPDAGYVEHSAKDWRNEAHIADFGELQTPAALHMIPHHNQCRRVMKQAAALLAPEWVGQLRTDLSALTALSERFVTIELDLGITFSAEIGNIQFDTDGADVKGLIIDFTSIDASAFAFNAATEEGEPSATPPDISEDAVPDPADFNVLIERRVSAGASYAVAVASWEPFGTGGLRVELQYRVSGATSWLSVQSSADATAVETPQLSDGSVHDFRARTRGETAGDWTATITRTVTVDTVAPGVPSALSVSAIGTTATIGWKHPASANTYGSRLYHNTSNTPGAATLIDTIYGGPNVVQSYDHAGLATGTHYYWVASINGSGVESARTAAGSVTI